MDHKPVRAILFDLDNTLIDTAGAGGVAIQKVSRLLRTSLGRDDTIIGQMCDKFKEKLLRERFDPTDDGKTIDVVRVGHWEESIREVAGSCPSSSSSSSSSLASECYYLWKHSRLEQLSISPETHSLLKELRPRYKLLLLTNGETQTQREKVVAVGCEELFDAIVVGGEHAEEKPCVSIFTHCFALLDVEPQDCVMVGDSLDTDIQGGFNAGVRATVWINNRGGFPPDCRVKPDYTVTTVLDIPNILADFN